MRSTTGSIRRAEEARRAGYTRLIVPPGLDGHPNGVKSVEEAVAQVWGGARRPAGNPALLPNVPDGMTAPLSAAPPTSPVWFRALVWLVPLLLIVTAWIPDDGADKPLPVAGSVALTLLGVGLGALFAQVPRRLAYTLTDTGLRVSRFSGTFEWPYRELRVRRTDAGLGLRVGGVGLPGYYTGNYTFTGAGYRSVQAIASNTRGGLIVERGGTPYYLTPADPDAFAQALAARGVPMLD